jgi:hypothetical protein
MKRAIDWPVVAAVLVCLSLTTSEALSQDGVEDEQAHVFTLQTWKIKFGDTDAYLDLYENEWLPLVRQNEFVIGHWAFKHFWGPDWTILFVEEFENLGTMAQAHEKYDELWEKKYPDKAERNAVEKMMSDLEWGHTDAIVTEVSKLDK